MTYGDAERIRADLTVVGGGIAGTCAAVAAARQGLDVALVNDRPVLGGSSSSEIRVHLCGATKIGHRGNRNRFAREGGLVEELTLRNRYRNRDGNPHGWDALLQDFVRNEERLSLFLNTLAVDVETDGDAITAVVGHQDGSERTFRFESPYYVDATGNGTVAVGAGAEWQQGPEARDEYGESLAPEEADDTTLGSTIMFTAKDVGEPVEFTPPDFAHDFVDDPPAIFDQHLNEFDPDRPYAWWIEYGGKESVDPLADNELVRDELWAIVYGAWDYVKNSGEFDGVETLALEWVGKIPGKRESQRIVGEYVLRQDDLIGSRRFEDAVGHGGWHIDLHPPKGIYDEEGTDTEGTTEADRVHWFFDGPYSYPYRSLYAPEVENLLLAGRLVSASRLAFASLRVQMTLGTTGQAAGTAAAVCGRHDTTPAGVYEHHLEELRQTLLREDQWIIDAENLDPNDLARSTSVRASSVCPPTFETSDRTVPLDENVGLHLPVVDGSEAVELLVEPVRDGARLEVEVWSEERPETYVPHERLHDQEFSLTGDGPQWIEVPLPKSDDGGALGDGQGVFLVLRATEDVRLHAGDDSRTGVLASAEAPDVEPDDSPWPLVEWTPCFRLTGDAPVYGPENVIDGASRPYGTPRCWASAPFADSAGGENEALPADEPWLELAWEEPKTVAAVQVTFNSDLTPWYNNLDPDDPPAVPALVRGYRIERATDDGWEPVVSETGNYQRLRRHVFDPVTTDRLRVVVEATNGLPRAEVFEVRAYGPDADAALSERPIEGE